MAFMHKGIEYYVGNVSTDFTISIPSLKNYFKVIKGNRIDSAHNKAKSVIEDEIKKNKTK